MNKEDISISSSWSGLNTSSDTAVGCKREESKDSLPYRNVPHLFSKAWHTGLGIRLLQYMVWTMSLYVKVGEEGGETYWCISAGTSQMSIAHWLGGQQRWSMWVRVQKAPVHFLPSYSTAITMIMLGSLIWFSISDTSSKQTYWYMNDYCYSFFVQIL